MAVRIGCRAACACSAVRATGQCLDRLREGLKLIGIFRRGDGRQDRLQGHLRLLGGEGDRGSAWTACARA